MDQTATQSEHHEKRKPRCTLSAWWMVLGAIVLAVAGLVAWVVVDVLPESRWMREHIRFSHLISSSRVITIGHGASSADERVLILSEAPFGPKWIADRMPDWYTEHLSRPTSMALSGGDWNSKDLEVLAGFQRLRTLILSGPDVDTLPVLPQVRDLTFHNAPMQSLDRFPNLETLDVDRPLDDKAVAAIRSRTTLRKLRIRGATERRFIDELKTSMPEIAIELSASMPGIAIER